MNSRIQAASAEIAHRLSDLAIDSRLNAAETIGGIIENTIFAKHFGDCRCNECMLAKANEDVTKLVVGLQKDRDQNRIDIDETTSIIRELWDLFEVVLPGCTMSQEQAEQFIALRSRSVKWI